MSGRIRYLVMSGLCALACAGLATAALAAKPAGSGKAALTLDSVNAAKLKKTISTGAAASPVLIKAQVLLDRASISPGVIDGMWGSNMKKALKAYQELKGLKETAVLDPSTWKHLAGDGAAEVLTTYTITEQDLKGPFVDKIPTDVKKMARLPRLGYTSPAEALAERFHLSETLLKKLNPGADFKKAGTEIVVANVGGGQAGAPVARLVVDRKLQGVRALGKDGKLVAFYPATVGSDEFPSPSGSLKVTAVAERPYFTFSSKLEYAKKLKKGETVKVPSGPNNPVGVVWIDLNKRGYGIHGTPEPSKVSKTASHGCVRLTNWDAQELARRVSKGMPVEFRG
jgi:lipoprotein-anchoring transpeptidase ErfK/SrfK